MATQTASISRLGPASAARWTSAPLARPTSPVIFAYHGYLWLIHRLTYRRTNHENVHVRGYKEEGTTTTPFDMCVMNQIDRYNLAMDVIDRVTRLQAASGSARETLKNKLIEHRIYIRSHGEDMPEIRDWQWTPTAGPTAVTPDAARATPEA
jgi:xylulose-5-phosphate/fructose-6-phosphate phosphoketolase